MVRAPRFRLSDEVSLVACDGRHESARLLPWSFPFSVVLF